MLANGGWLTWTTWRAPTNASKWRMGFNSAFKRLTTTLPQAPTSARREDNIKKYLKDTGHQGAKWFHLDQDGGVGGSSGIL